MNFKHILLALMPLCIASCSKEENFVSDPVKQEVRVIADASAHSRIALSDDEDKTHTLWQNGDRISLFTAFQSNLVYSTTTEENVATAEFTPVGEELLHNEGEVVYACYPEVTQVSGEGMVVNLPATETIDYADGAIRSFGYAVGTVSDAEVSLEFKHISAFLCLKVTAEELMDATKAISHVTISTSSDVPLSVGEGDTFDFDTQTATTTHGSNTVQVNVDNLVIGTDRVLYIPILPQPAGANITITLADSEGSTQYSVTKQVPESGFLAGNVYKHGFLNDTNVAYLADGVTFNSCIKQLASGASYVNVHYYVYNIRKIEFVTEVQTIPEKYVVVSSDDSPVPVYASFNQADGLLRISTSAPTIEIVNASYLFFLLSGLSEIDFGNFTLSETATSTVSMFSECTALTSLDLSKWNVENVTDMYMMFQNCSALTNLNLANWNFRDNVKLGYMFDSCASSSQNCEITATQEVQDFLLNKTGTTRMTSEWFSWKNVAEEPDTFSIVGTWEMIEGDMDMWIITFREDGTGRDSWEDQWGSDEYEFTYNLDWENRKLYTLVQGEEESSEWEIFKYSDTELTLRYYSDEEATWVYFVFKKI